MPSTGAQPPLCQRLNRQIRAGMLRASNWSPARRKTSEPLRITYGFFESECRLNSNGTAIFPVEGSLSDCRTSAAERSHPCIRDPVEGFAPACFLTLDQDVWPRENQARGFCVFGW